MNETKIFNANCLDILPTIPSESIDLILCDLPYGITKNSWDSIIPFEQLWKEYNRIIKNRGIIALFGSEPFSSYLRLSNINFYRYDWIWEKNKATQYLNAKKRPLNNYEIISIFYKAPGKYYPQMSIGKSYSNKHTPGDSGTCYGSVKYSERKNVTTRYPKRIIKFPVDIRAEYHPTQKPLDLLEYLIKTYTDENDIVLDNCMGSGSTGVACIKTNRSFIGIEIDKDYFDIAKTRLENTQKEAKNG